MSSQAPKTCVNHKIAEYVCVSRDCSAKCAYSCANPSDSCHSDHALCSFMNLNSIKKIMDAVMVKKQMLQTESLYALQATLSNFAQRLNSIVDIIKLVDQMRDVLDPHGLFGITEKECVNKFSISSTRTLSELPGKKFEEEVIAVKNSIEKYLSAIKGKGENEGVTEQIFSEVKSAGRKSQVKESRSSKVKEIEPKQVKAPLFQSILEGVIKDHVPRGPLFSSITNDLETIQSFFPRKFENARLLYRASEQDFLVSRFHGLCDGMTNTLTLVFTEGEKAIGGFTCLPWKSSGQWYPDPSESSFLFSLSTQQKFPLKVKEKAIWCNSSYGPSFGHPDLQIADKASSNTHSCANFPQCYNNGNYKDSGGTLAFSGSKTGHFRVREWEVYQLTF